MFTSQDWQGLAASSEYQAAIAIQKLLQEEKWMEAGEGLAFLIESMGKSKKLALKSQLTRLMAHVIKWKCQPEKRSSSWSLTILSACRDIEEIQEEVSILNRHYIESVWDQCFERAVQEAELEMQKECELKLLSWEEIFETDYTKLKLNKSEEIPSFFQTDQTQKIRIVTDGACSGNPGSGGWAALIIRNGKTEEIGGFEPQTTNNRMEMQAAIEGLKRVPLDAKIQLLTDSQYLINGITKWLSGWKKRDWLTAEGLPVKNQDLWQELEQLTGNRVTWEYVRGHAGHPENERADTIAQAYSKGQQPPPPTSLTDTSSSPKKVIKFHSVSYPTYLTLVDSQLCRHKTWVECEAVVKGLKGAKFKKCKSAAEEQETLQKWGVSTEAFD